MKITLKATCQHCGNQYEYTAKGKADAKRMEKGEAICNKCARKR